MAAKKGNKNALGNEGGRPSKMPDDLIKKSLAYIKQCEDDLEEVVKQTREDGTVITTTKELKVNLPSLAGLAVWLDVSRDTVYEWQQSKIEFSDICSKILTLQEMILINKALAGVYNSNITKLLLTKHGYTDKTDITSDGKALPTPIYGGKSII